MWSRSESNEITAPVSGHWPGPEIVPAAIVGTQDVVSRTTSELGRGWSLPELDRLDVQNDGVSLITGANEAIWFQEDGSSYIRRGPEITRLPERRTATHTSPIETRALGILHRP